jgi:NAD(P) transhydrogenase subunit alpha
VRKSFVQSGLGRALYVEDADYEKAGARVSKNREEMLRDADLVLRVRQPPESEIPGSRAAQSTSVPRSLQSGTLTAKLAAANVSAISMEMIPRTTLAQKMDALSSQASWRATWP